MRCRVRYQPPIGMPTPRSTGYRHAMLIVLLAACTPDPALEAGDVTVERMGPTVQRVSWTSDEPGIGFVRYSRPGEPARITRQDAVATTDHRFVVAGMTPSETWQIAAFTKVEGEDVSSGAVEVETEAIPAGAADVGEITGAFNSAQFVLETTAGSGEGLVIYDQTGTIVWSLPVDLGRLSARARLEASGAVVTVGLFTEGTAGLGAIVSYGLDGTELASVPILFGHHDYDRIPEGFAYLKQDVREFGGEEVMGDALVEVDEAGNELRQVWSSWDSWEPPPGLEVGPYGTALDWTHANTLEYQESTDEYMVSLHNLNAVIFIDRTSGTITRQVGGAESTVELVSGSAFARQHSPMLRGKELYVFDNGDGGVSAVRGYRLDDSAGTYAERWSIPNPAGAEVLMLGDVYRTESNVTLSSWGSAGILAEFDEVGQQTFRLDLDIGAAFGFFQPISELGGPSPD